MDAALGEIARAARRGSGEAPYRKRRKVAEVDVEEAAKYVREHAPAEGMSDDQIRTAFEAVATGALDGPLAMGILRSMFPRETVSGDTVCAMCSQLFRLVPAQQVFLLKWVLMCFATLDDSGHHALRQLYSVFFAALDYEYLRYWAIRVLYTTTCRAHIQPFRVRRLFELHSRLDASGQPTMHTFLLLDLYSRYYPNRKASLFRAVDKRWSTALTALRAQVRVDIRTGRAVGTGDGGAGVGAAAGNDTQDSALQASQGSVVSVTGPMDRFVPRMRGQTAAAGPGVAPAGTAVAAAPSSGNGSGGATAGGSSGAGRVGGRRAAGTGYVPGLETHAAPLRAMTEADAEDGTGGHTPHRAGAGPAGGGAATVPTAESAVGLGARVAVAAARALHRTASSSGPRTQGTAEQRASLVSVGELASASDLTAALLSRRVGVALPDRAAAVLGDRVMQHLLALAPRREALARLAQTLPLFLEEAFFPMDAPESAPPAAPSRRPAAHSSAAECWSQRMESDAADVRAATHAARGVPDPVHRIGSASATAAAPATAAGTDGGSGRGRGRGRRRGPDFALRAARRREVLRALVSAAAFLHELPVAAEGLVIRLLRSWDGESHADALMTLVSWMRPRTWDELYAEVARPLAAALAAARPQRQAAALCALAQLAEHWASSPWSGAAGREWQSQEDWMLASPDARADRYRAVQELCAFANRVAHLSLTCSGDHPVVQHAAARVADASAHVTVSHGLPFVLAPSPPVLLRLLLARNAFAVSRGCDALVRFRAAFTQARSVADTDPDAFGRSSASDGTEHIGLFNSLAWDASCILWRNQPLPKADGKARSLLFDLPPEALQALQGIPAEARDKALSVTHHPALAGYARRWARATGRRSVEECEGDDRVQYVLQMGGGELAGLHRFLTTFMKTLARAKAAQSVSMQ